MQQKGQACFHQVLHIAIEETKVIYYQQLFDLQHPNIQIIKEEKVLMKMKLNKGKD